VLKLNVACVASVSVGFGSKERPRNGIFGVFPARKMGREPKNEGWDRGNEGTFVPLPLPLFLSDGVDFLNSRDVLLIYL